MPKYQEGTFEWYKSELDKIISSDMKIYQNQLDAFQLLYWMGQDISFDDRKVRDYAMKVSKFTHEYADYMCGRDSSGKFDELYWRLLLFESPHILDSYCLFIEKNRKPQERFYEPRRKTLKKVVDKLQMLEDDELDELFCHQPARTGKLLADDTPVLTEKGWKNHGDLIPGDKVYGIDGKLKKVLYVFPKNKADCLVTFSNGEQIQCHENHEWVVNDRVSCGNKKTLTTKEIEHGLAEYKGPIYRYEIGRKKPPEVKGVKIDKFNYIKSIRRVKPKPGNCIQVEGGMYCVGKTMIPTHNSQIITVGTSWHCAKNPEISNLYVTYKEGLGGAFNDGVMEIWTDPTYCFKEVFPYIKIARTDAKNNKVDLNRKKKYATLSGKGLESGLNGEYDAYGWLILDDILEGIQDVLNPDILKRKQIVFDNNVMSRKKEQCKLILNGTIWSLHDLYMNRLEFLKSNPEAKDIRYDVLKIPALDPETDESNFDYDYGVGFTTKYYRIMRAKFEENGDMAGWLAQYQQEPIERDGAVFSPENMPNRYDGNLPEEPPLKVVAACDVALGGMDYLSMPVAYVYGDGSVYIHDVVYDNSEKKITQPKVLNALISNGVTNAFFEANAGGEGYKDDIERLLSEQGVKINLVSKYAQQMIVNSGKGGIKTHQRKEQRIWDNAETIRQFYFREPGCQSLEYRKFMNNLYSFTITGKNKTDDGADSAAMLAVFLNKGSGVKTTRIINSPF